ncbi:uncharacterized protein LOC117339296 [Pecten maximus]|uniref:uncharacterized protein LOC117339296 n=1 Tax=Pecten maximus TaxID=6579 RepID=UPI001458D9E8|nr:uncharacterized protein LOC117339296 [Pecten maximus]
MLAGRLSLLVSLLGLTNAINLVDLLSKLRRGSGVGGPSTLYDGGASVNTVSFELPEGHGQAAFQSHLIPQKPPSKATSNFHGLLRQFAASSDVNTGHSSNYQNAAAYSNRGQYNSAPQVPTRRQFPSTHLIPNRSPSQQEHRAAWNIPNQNSAGGQQYHQGYTQRPVPASISRIQIPQQTTGFMQGQLPRSSRVQVPRQNGFTRTQTPVSNYGTGQASRKMEFTRELGPVPNHSRTKIQRTTGFARETLPMAGRGRAQVSQRTGFTRTQMPTSTNQAGSQQISRNNRFIPKHFPQSSQVGAQEISRNNAFAQKQASSKVRAPTASRNSGFAQKHTQTNNHAAVRQFAQMTKASPGSAFGQQPSKPRYRTPHNVRSRRF